MSGGCGLCRHNRMRTTTMCEIKYIVLHALQKGDGYFNEYIWLSQLHICSLNTEQVCRMCRIFPKK